MRVGSQGQEDHLKEEMATHSNILAWKIPGTEEPRRLQTVGSIAKTQTQLSTLQLFTIFPLTIRIY